jgi:hypothetical protein
MSLLFNAALECTIRKVQVNREGIKLNGTYWRLVCIKNVNSMSENINKNVKASLVHNKVVCLEVNIQNTTKNIIHIHTSYLQYVTCIKREVPPFVT